MTGVLKDATKKILKQNQTTDYVSRNKAALAGIPNKPQDRVESQIPKNKQYDSVTPKYLEKNPSVKPEDKENNPGASSKVVKPKPQPTKSNHIQIENVQNQRQPSINRSNKRSENVDTYISTGVQSQKGSLSQKRRTDQGSYSSKNNLGNPRSKSPMEKKVHVASPIVEEPVKKDSPKVSISREVTKSNMSKARDKSKKREQYKPETMDLFSRLNEYSKFKENCDKLCQPELDDSLIAPRPVTNKNQSKDKAKAEEFLKKQITDFKENSPRKKRSAVQSSIDLQRVSQPRFKKQAVQIANECSFQPMLSKKSLAIVQKNGYSKDNLYQSRTPKKNEDDADESDTHRPKLCQKSMHIDQAKRRLEMPRFEVLGRMGQEYSHRKKRQAKMREQEEESQFRSMSFKPDCKQKPPEKSVVTPFNADVIDRNQKWSQRREEKLSRLKMDKDKSINASCSFKPQITKYQKDNEHDDSQYYSSVFVKDGIQSYFTRLEQARRMKKEAHERLENWGRDKSKSIQKPSEPGQLLDISHISKFDNAGIRPQWETPGTKGYSSRHSRNGSQQGYSSKKRGQPSQNDVDKTVAILRENLKKIQIHLN